MQESNLTPNPLNNPPTLPTIKDPAERAVVGEALRRIPSGVFLMTAAFEDRKIGMLCSFVQQVCIEPPMVCVAVGKGRSIMPLISESRQFGLCQLADDDRMVRRKFMSELDPQDDPFLGFELLHSKLPGLPILKSAVSYLECELSCHMDVEGDHDLFVGLVRSGGNLNDKEPTMRLRQDGFDYE